MRDRVIIMRIFVVGVIFWWSIYVGRAEATILVERNEDGAFHFRLVPAPARNDIGSEAVVSLVLGRLDGNSGGLARLNDGQLPREEDAPAENCFFAAGTAGGRIVLDLTHAVAVQRINSYSWHPGSRAAQVYTLYGRTSEEKEVNVHQEKSDELANLGWKEIARVDTRKEGNGGQIGVSIFEENGILGKFRYLLFDISATEKEDAFGNTFFSEIDVEDREGKGEPIVMEQERSVKMVEAGEAKYQITIDTTETPDLKEWAEKELAPVVKEWYPKLVKALPSPGYSAPAKVNISFSKHMRGVAATGGTRIRCAAEWFRKSLNGEAKGAVVHELVHVVQQYGRARRENPNANRTPGWIVEGIPDYLRWYHYEPESGGAEIKNISRARYDASYRPTANFLNWVVNKYSKDLVVKLNAAAREGRYDESIWQKETGKTVQELGEEWNQEIQKKLAGGQ